MDGIPDWDSLKVTFLKFNNLPLSASDAKANGWKQIDSCNANNFFAGKRFVLNGDKAVMLLFDSQGKIAGIQMGVAKQVVGAKNRPWVAEGNDYVMTAYFVDPQTICNGKRATSKYIGDGLFIQMGVSRNDVMRIPYQQKDLKSKWVKGKCVWLMGKHYWYKISKDMNCDDFFPVFLLYNRGKLNGFGWNTIGNAKSRRYEHPPMWSLKGFFNADTLPQCLKSVGPLTTQHIYFDSAYNNFC